MKKYFKQFKYLIMHELRAFKAWIKEGKSTLEPKFPELIVDLSKCKNGWDVEGKVHEQMKNHFFSKKHRQTFTHEIQNCKNWDEVILTTKKWVTIKNINEK
jgi:hypothetical protein